MKKKLYWKELTDDGLMKEPEEQGPHYSPERLNNFGQGYDSEGEAFADYEELKKNHPFRVPSSLVLITKYLV